MDLAEAWHSEDTKWDTTNDLWDWRLNGVQLAGADTMNASARIPYINIIGTVDNMSHDVNMTYILDNFTQSETDWIGVSD